MEIRIKIDWALANSGLLLGCNQYKCCGSGDCGVLSALGDWPVLLFCGRLCSGWRDASTAQMNSFLAVRQL